MIEFFSSLVLMFNESAVYLLVGFGVAGALRYVLSEERFLRWFGKSSFGSVLKASLLGIPIPLCSCSVLPVAVAMKKRGASKGAVTSFLISTPETGVDSISITWALLDPVMTVARPVSALITALFTGSVINWFTRRGMDKEIDDKDGVSECCSCAPGEGAGNENGEGRVTEAARAKGSFLAKTARFGYITLLDDMVSVLFFAFLCSGFIAVIVPGAFFDTPLVQGFSGLLLMLVVGIPLYICATASTPIAAILILKGLSPGAALVFLLAGPATNLGSLIALSKYLGKKTIAVYITCICAVTLFLGALVDSVYSDYNIDITQAAGRVSETIPFPLKAAGAIVLFALMVRSAAATGMFLSWGQNLRKICRPFGLDPLGRRALLLVVVLALLLYGSTAVSLVDVGEAGWILTFGEVTRSLDEPGLYTHLPYPFEIVKTCRPDDVRTIEFGFERTGEGGVGSSARSEATLSLAAEAEVMNGEENIVSVKFSIHYSLADPYLYVFENTEPDAAVRAFASSAVREIGSLLTTNRILVSHRKELEEMTRALVQTEADNARIGVKILKVTFLDVHAPPGVHYAFRDVASASEDKHRKKLEAESVLFETVALARGRAQRIIQDARAYEDEIVSEAQGRSEAFRAVAAAAAGSRDLTLLRLYLEAMEKALARTGTVVPFDSRIDVELWMNDRSRVPPLQGPPFLGEGAGVPSRDAKRGGAEPGGAPDPFGFGNIDKGK